VCRHLESVPDVFTNITAANLVLTDPPGGPLRLKHLRRAVAKIAAHERALLARAAAGHAVNGKSVAPIHSIS
jgi:hypothetical protein